MQTTLQFSHVISDIFATFYVFVTVTLDLVNNEQTTDQ